MTPKEIIENDTLSPEQKIAAIEDYVKQEAMAFVFFVHPAGVYQESLYTRYLMAKTKPV